MFVIAFAAQVLLFAALLWISVRLVAPKCQSNHFITALILSLLYSFVLLAMVFPLNLLVGVAFWVIVSHSYDLGFVRTVMVVVIMTVLSIVTGILLAPFLG